MSSRGMIGVDAFNICIPKGSGIATYARNLVGAVRSLGYRAGVLYGPEHEPGQDALLNEINLFNAGRPAGAERSSRLDFARSLARGLFSPLGQRAKVVTRSETVITEQIALQAPACDQTWVCRDVFRGANRIYRAFGRFTPLTFEGGPGPDVMHWTCNLPLRAVGRANLYTLHDLAPLRLPFASLEHKARYLSMCREIGRTADRIVTVSEHSARDIVSLLGVDRGRIEVTYQSVDLTPALSARSDDDVARELGAIFGLDWRGYFIFFGAVEPKKNLGRIIEAHLASGVSSPLVIIGGRAWLEADQLGLMHDDIIQASVLKDGVLRRSDRIRLYQFMPPDLLVSLIRGAKATLAPSLYEGFGLPILESMQLRTPVIASTAGAGPEIAGEAALLVDPYDSQALRRAITAIDADADLRADLTDRGVAQAAKFSPANYQERLRALYQPFV